MKINKNNLYIIIIIISILIKFIGITNPGLEVSHNWRQALSNMAALNYFEFGYDISEPGDRFSGQRPGIAPMEFPLLPSLIWGISKLFNCFSDWYGRIIILLFSVAGIYAAFLSIRHYFDKETAFITCIALSYSIWLPFSRKVMPDILSFSLMLTSINFIRKYIIGKNFLNLFLCMLTFSLALLTKISSIIYLSCFIIIIAGTDLAKLKKLYLFSLLILCITPALYWYYVHVPELALKNPSGHFFMGKSMIEGIRELKQFPGGLLQRLFVTPMHYIGGLIFVVSLVKWRKHTHEISLFIASFLILIPVLLKTGMHFVHHDYYVLPLVPFIALGAGSLLRSLKEGIVKWMLIIGIVIEGIVHFYPDLMIHGEMRKLEGLADKLDSLDIQSPVVINGGLNPCAMFYTGRYGWSLSNEEIKDMNNQKILIKGKCNAIVILRKTFEKEMESPGKLIYSDEDFLISELSDEQE